MQAKPIFVVNCKEYENTVGPAMIALAKDLADAARAKSVRLILCVPFTEIRSVVAAVNIPVYAQHVDPLSPGAHTGWITPQMLVAAGATGTLLNHSEHRVTEGLEESVRAARAAGLQVILCARDATEVKILRNLDVEYIAVEPSELIGGDISISTARPELISASAKQCPDKLLVGAGVKHRGDIVKALELGAHGVLIASGIMKAARPKDAFLDLCAGW